MVATDKHALIRYINVQATEKSLTWGLLSFLAQSMMYHFIINDKNPIKEWSLMVSIDAIKHTIELTHTNKEVMFDFVNKCLVGEKNNKFFQTILTDKSYAEYCTDSNLLVLYVAFPSSSCEETVDWSACKETVEKLIIEEGLTLPHGTYNEPGCSVVVVA